MSPVVSRHLPTASALAALSQSAVLMRIMRLSVCTRRMRCHDVCGVLRGCDGVGAQELRAPVGAGGEAINGSGHFSRLLRTPEGGGG
jgi:hypothetical protein